MLALAACRDRAGSAGATSAQGTAGGGTSAPGTAGGRGGTTGAGGGGGGPPAVIDGLGPSLQANCNTGGNVDVRVVVTTALGPVQVDINGQPITAPAPLAITNAVYSEGIYDPTRSDYDVNDAGYVAAQGAQYDAFSRPCAQPCCASPPATSASSTSSPAPAPRAPPS